MCERVFKGNIIFACEFGKYEIIKNGYIVVMGNEIIGVYSELPSKFKDSRIFDYGEKLIIPGFVDLRSEFFEKKQAVELYPELVMNIRKSGTTRMVMKGTDCVESNIILMDTIAKTGLGAFVGNPEIDEDVDSGFKRAKSDAEELLLICSNKYELVKPILAIGPEKNCSQELRREFFKVASRYGSKLNLNLSPEDKIDSSSILDLLEHGTAVLSNYIDMKKFNIDDLSSKPLYIEYSSDSKLGESSIRSLLKKSIPVGLSSSGSSSGISVKDKISEMAGANFSIPELFYMATKGGGSFFGKVGSFEVGYEFDALVIDDSQIGDIEKFGLEERLDRYLRMGDKENIVDIYVGGQRSLGV